MTLIQEQSMQSRSSKLSTAFNLVKSRTASLEIGSPLYSIFAFAIWAFLFTSNFLFQDISPIERFCR